MIRIYICVVHPYRLEGGGLRARERRVGTARALHASTPRHVHVEHARLVVDEFAVALRAGHELDDHECDAQRAVRRQTLAQACCALARGG